MVGRAARMRVSSVMAPLSSRGTLKSTRTNTDLPFKSVLESEVMLRLAKGENLHSGGD